MTTEEILAKEKWLKDKEIRKVIPRENYGIVFIEQNDFDEDESIWYETIAKIIYNQEEKRVKRWLKT